LLILKAVGFRPEAPFTQTEFSRKTRQCLHGAAGFFRLANRARRELWCWPTALVRASAADTVFYFTETHQDNAECLVSATLKHREL
jgi:hypothetical protein